jgi:rubrerythrin
VPAADHKFSDAINLPNLGDNPDDQAVLQYALGREHAAMEQYGELAESAVPGPIRDLLRFLAAEKTQHKAELEKLYY